MKILDALVIGGGPAGLSAALILGRCRRQVLICDAGHYRNQSSSAMYGYLSRDGIPPLEFLQISREQLTRYPNIQLLDIDVRTIEHHESLFKGLLANGEQVLAKMVILATGMTDEILDIPGIMDFFGKSVFLCPYCDGWEFRDQPIVAYGQGDHGPCFALLLREWTPDVILCTDGEIGGTPEERKRLQELKIPVITDPILRLEGREGKLERVVFRNNKIIERSALFFSTPSHPNTKIAESLGCKINPKGEVEVESSGLSSVPGIYVAGDASADIKLAIVAAAEGAKVGYAINKEILKRERLILD